MTRATVALLNWNGGRFVEPCVRSLLAQTETSLEIVIVDNGSTDGSDTTIEMLIADARVPVRMIRNVQNRGICGGLQQALGEAAGMYFFPFASDDVMAPDRVARQVAQLDAAGPNVSIAAGAVALIGSDGQAIKGRFKRPIVLRPADYGDYARTRDLAGRPVVPKAPGMAFRTETLRQVGGYDPAAPVEDLDVFLRLIFQAQSGVATTNHVVAQYRRHGSNASLNADMMGDGLDYTIRRLQASGVDFGLQAEKWRGYLQARDRGYRSPWGNLTNTLNSRPLDRASVRKAALNVAKGQQMSTQRRVRAVVALCWPALAARRVSNLNDR